MITRHALLFPTFDLISQGITGSLGQPVIVDNRTGFIGIEGIGSSPAEFAAIIKADMGRMGKVIKETGIRGVN